MIAGHGSSISECLNIIIYGYELLVMLDLQPEITSEFGRWKSKINTQLTRLFYMLITTLVL